jgi:hypothetical protein
VLERIGLGLASVPRKHAFDALGEGSPEIDRQALEALLRLDPEIRRSRFAWLRDCPESPAPSNMLALLDRLDFVRDLGNHAARASPIILLGSAGWSRKPAS